ncbi:serine threonine kinase [Fusarium globosum]|uniref:Serine threonine kinase n=1 Tax=Fusarium globosum TaxID=78864 RepID=A0A8H5Y9E0_9HYPO|nr:serine threonine kinase [Fusarium globosum]
MQGGLSVANVSNEEDFVSIDIVTDRSLTTQGDTTNPTGRFYPRRIVPWDAFPTEQEKVWADLAFSPSFAAQPSFPSRHQLEYVESLLHPISSEIDLRNSERDVVENAVQKLVDATYADLTLRNHLDLNGTLTFESHTNLGIADESLSESMDQVSLSSRPSARTSRRRKARGKGNRADQFCISRTSDGQRFPAVAIEYKAPHKLSRDEVITGLVGEIQPNRDVINQEGEGFEFEAKRLTTAVITQLFSYMVGKGTQYGYVCTGETYIFLHIPRDPSCVYYSVCIPSLDVEDDDENRLHRTAVAQVYAFVLQAIRSPLPSQAWHNAADQLDTWAVEYDDVLRSIPATLRKAKRTTPYRAQRWKGFTRSPIRTRSQCLPLEDKKVQSSDDDNEDDESPSPTPNLTGRPLGESRGTSSSETQMQGRVPDTQGNADRRQNIRDRPYCTHACLRGIASGGPLDERCPNIADHGEAHIDRQSFVALLRDQLATDCGDDADSTPLGISGSRGSLFKLCLSLRGYTLVAKGVEAMDAIHIRHENKMYDHVWSLQGTVVPVCLGIVDLIKPYYFDSGIYVHFLLLSYGGRPVLREMKEVRPDVVDQIIIGLKRLHQYRILHHDAEPRNVLYDRSSGRCMWVDLMLAEIHDRQPLGSINCNRQSRKRKSVTGKHVPDAFSDEVQSLRARLIKRLSDEDVYSHLWKTAVLLW